MTASWHKPALLSGSILFAVLVILTIIWACYRWSKRLKEVEHRRADDTETGQEENYCKGQDQKQYNEQEFECNKVVIEEPSETKTKACDDKRTYKQMIVTWHL